MATTKPGLASLRAVWFCLLLAVMLMWSGCLADVPLNPSFPLTLSDARLALKEMEKNPRPPARPIVVLGGIYDLGIASSGVARRIRRVMDAENQIINISFFGCSTFDQCRTRVIDRVQEAFPSDDPDLTTVVDVIALSMGGLVARHAADMNGDGNREIQGRRRLRIGRLFTISTPHRGANLAWVPTLDSRVVDMKSDSPFLMKLDLALDDAEFEIYSYTRLGDAIVGPANTAPPGRDPWWVANIPGSFSHLLAMFDLRFLADIACRLRSETPFTRDPPAPLPGPIQGNREIKIREMLEYPRFALKTYC